MPLPIVIIGAGPAGLACAYKILKESKKKVILIEKEPSVGGAGRSFKWKDNILDYGPHAFHTRGGEPEQILRSLFEDNSENLIEGRKRIHVYLKKKLFKYPLQVGEVLRKFNVFLSLKIIIEFFLTSIFHSIVSIPVESFEDWGRKRFGSSLYKISFGNYTEKVWKTRAEKISEKFASEKIQGFNFIDLLKRLLRIGGQVTEPYYQSWLYHKFGSGELFKRLSDEIIKLGGEIFLSTKLISVERAGENIKSIKAEKNAELIDIPCGYLVNTIPIPRFILLFGEGVPFVIKHAVSKLTYISLVIVYLEFDVDRISRDHWFYLLEKKFKFNRVTEQKNLSEHTIERGKTILSFEMTCREGDSIWGLSDKELINLAKEECRNIHFIGANKVTNGIVKRFPDAYELYYKNFDHYAELLFFFLGEINNVVSIGRRGLFLQGDMHQSMEMGLEIGELLANEKLTREKVIDFYKKYVRYLDQ